MALLRASLVASLAVLAACYSPSIQECTIRCGAAGACPSGTTCGSDDFCHGDTAVICGPDGPIGVADARPGAPDAPRNRIDARTGAPDAPHGCTTLLEDIDTMGKPEFGGIGLAADQTTLRVTYIRGSSGALWEATKTDAGWQTARVHDADDAPKGQFLDESGNLHVAYLLSGVLHYAVKLATGTTWGDMPVTAEGGPTDPTITVDPLGRVHIGFYAKSVGELHYATPRVATVGWNIEIVDSPSNGDVGEFPSIAWSATVGRPFISYRDVAGKSLKLASRVSGSWSAGQIDQTTSKDVGSYTSLAIDATGVLHIAYADNQNNTLRYLRDSSSGNMPVRVLADNQGGGQWNSIGVDPAGGVHISTYAPDAKDLRVAYRPAGGTFTAAPVETAGDVGLHTGIAVDALGGAHIVYTDAGRGALRHAYLCPP